MVRLTIVRLVAVASCSVVFGSFYRAAAQDYFPTKVGAKKVFTIDGGDKEVTETVTAVKKTDSETFVTVSCVNEFGKTREVQFKVSKDGLFQLTGGPGAVKHKPMWLLRLPHEKGNKWKSWMGTWAENELYAYGPEKIKTPAGEFDAIRVESEFFTIGPRVLAKYWYAPGVGLLKETVNGQDTFVLKTFKP
jgi:hypothetical protein